MAPAREKPTWPEMFRLSNGLQKDTRIRLLWLAIAVDLDNTYEAYWGDVSEMRVIPRKTGDHGYRIRVAQEDRARYTSEGRRLACREPVEIRWEDFPGEWAHAARQAYLKLDMIEDCEQRIEEAVKMYLQPMKTNPKPKHKHAEENMLLSDDLSTAHCAVSSEPDDVDTPTLERALEKCSNAEVATFVRQRLADASQGRIKRALSYSCLGRNGSRPVVGWYLTLFGQHLRVRQRGRFSGDERFWRICVSNPDSVKPLNSGNHLRFNLSTAADCRMFQAVMENVGPRIQLK
jgi:hypothetical protein